MEQNKNYALEIEKFLPQKELRILEVGCGTGLLGSQFLKGNNHLLGIDTSSGMLSVFNEKFKNNPQVKSYLLNLETENLAENGFELIVSSMAFHHLVNPLNILKKLKELSSPGGIIALIDLEAEDGSFHPDPKKMGVHHFGFTKAEAEQWAESAGLTLMDRKIIYSIHKNEKDYPIFLAVFKRSH
jgi:ubiquinone/menaquinone biosynthesis C-methylase UbiE